MVHASAAAIGLFLLTGARLAELAMTRERCIATADEGIGRLLELDSRRQLPLVEDVKADAAVLPSIRVTATASR